MAGEIIIPLLHGFEVLPHNDPFLDLAEAANDTLNNVTPGRYLVVRLSSASPRILVTQSVLTGQVPIPPIRPQLVPRCSMET